MKGRHNYREEPEEAGGLAALLVVIVVVIAVVVLFLVFKFNLFVVEVNNTVPSSL